MLPVKTCANPPLLHLKHLPTCNLVINHPDGGEDGVDGNDIDFVDLYTCICLAEGGCEDDPAQKTHF